MSITIFASDLDNTLIFSYKHKMEDDICIEMLHGQEQGFCRKETFVLLEEITKKVCFIPITTRSMEQYHRICLPISCVPEYALTTNGAILLHHGQIDAKWYQESKKIADTWKTELLNVECQFQDVKEIKRFRMIDDMYLFAVCDHIEDAKVGKFYFDGKTDLHVEASGRKLYFFPPGLSKGDAIDRLREKFTPDCIISAGDSQIDIPMLQRADCSIFMEKYDAQISQMICYQGNDVRSYTKFVLQQVLQKIVSQDVFSNET